ncbi:MAG: threonine-phosphate decarboxylase [Hyphomicrobium sp.]|nr:MAG: threonine-phosphate decarboxylase [Hyphomicrobium sp.]PPD01349.1 MAG: threonine-phosphate decarboxylase [Hyphomicrobium sp.]
MPSPQARSITQEFIAHGGRISVARARFPDAPTPWLDLSTGISPWAYPIPELPVECWTRLPDPGDLDALISVARDAYGVDERAHVVPVAGTDLAINLIPRLVGKPLDVAIVAPTYTAHQVAWGHAGHRVSLVDDVRDIGDSGVAIVVNPNNPDGRVWTAEQLLETGNRLARNGGFLIVDEAFCDCVPEMSVLSKRHDLSHVIVLRSFGKFYGLAGVRLGFIVTGRAIGGELAALMSEWPVSGPAIAIGRQALADRVWADMQRLRLAEAAVRLNALLEREGLTLIGGTSLFSLAAHDNAPAVFERLAMRGILVRPMANPRLLRFGIPGYDRDFARLQAAFTS